MAQQPGPFSAYLTETFKPAPQQPNGTENGLGTAAYIANQFLNGIKQTRLQRAAVQEANQEKDRQAYQMAIQTVQNNPDILPAKKNEWITKLTQGLISQVAGTKETSKDTGNPITDYLKSVALNLTGGSLPKKGAPLDRNLIADVLTGVNDPHNTVREVTGQAEQFFRQAIDDLKSKGANTQEEVLSHPELNKMLATVRNSTGLQDWTPTALSGVMQFWPKDKTALSAQQAAIARNTQVAQAANEYSGVAAPAAPAQSAPTTAPPPTTATPPVTAAPPITGAVGGQPSATPPQQAPVSRGNMLSDMMRQNENAKLANFPERHKLGNPTEMVNSKTGQIISAIPFTSSKYGQGMIDASTGQVISDPLRKATANDRNRPSPERAQQLFEKINTELINAVGPEEAKKWQGTIRSNIETGDERGAGDIPAKAMAAAAHREQIQALRDDRAAALAQKGEVNKSSIIMRLGSRYDSSQPVQDLRTAERYAQSAHDAYNAVLKNPASAGLTDIELMRTWAKLTDIMTGVREGEYRDLASILGKMRALGVGWDALFNQNGGRLDDPARKDLVRSIDSIYGRIKTQHDKYAESIRNTATKLGVDPNIIVDPSMFNPTPTTAPPRDRGTGKSTPVGGIGAPPPRRRANQTNQGRQLVAPNL